MLSQQLDGDQAESAGSGSGSNNNYRYGATSRNANNNDNSAGDEEVDTLSYTDTQGDGDDSENDTRGSDHYDDSDDSETDTATGTGTNNTSTDYTDERSGLLSSLGGSFTRRHRRNHSNASGSLRTLNTLDEMVDGGAGNRARAGSFVSYSTSTLILERTKQTLRYCFELFFPSDDDDDDDAADDGTFDPWESPDVRRSYDATNGRSGNNNHLYSSTTRHRIAVMFNCFLLVIAYSTERASFKVLVDKAGPFRLLSAEIITGLHALVLGLGMATGKAARYFAARNKAAKSSSGSSTSQPQHHHRPPDSAVSKGVGVPLADLGLMAVLDTAHLLLSVISGSIIPPVLTVILVQLTIPLAVYATEFLHPKGRFRKAGGVLCCLDDLDEEDALGDDGLDSQGYQRSPVGGATPNRSNVGGSGAGGERSSNMRSSIGSQATTALASRPETTDEDDASVSSFGRLSGRLMCGAFLITISITLVLSPAILIIADPPSQHITSKFQESETKGVDPAIASTRSAWNTLLFAAACIPAAASQLHKEHTLASQRQPVDPNRLNLALSIFSSIFALIVSPLLMPLQGLAAGINWTGIYPSKETSSNFLDGLKCFAGTLDETVQSTLYPESASCRFLWLVVLLHVLAIIIAGVAVERIVYRGATKLLHLCISAGFVLAITAMYSYEIIDSSHIYGPIAYGSHFVAATIALIGLHMHSSEQYSAELYCSDYDKIDDLYAEEEE